MKKFTYRESIIVPKEVLENLNKVDVKENETEKKLDMQI